MEYTEAATIARSGLKKASEVLASKETSHRGARKIVSILMQEGKITKQAQTVIQGIMIARWGTRR